MVYLTIEGAPPGLWKFLGQNIYHPWEFFVGVCVLLLFIDENRDEMPRKLMTSAERDEEERTGSGEICR